MFGWKADVSQGFITRLRRENTKLIGYHADGFLVVIKGVMRQKPNCFRRFLPLTVLILAALQDEGETQDSETCTLGWGETVLVLVSHVLLPFLALKVRVTPREQTVWERSTLTKETREARG